MYTNKRLNANKSSVEIYHGTPQHTSKCSIPLVHWLIFRPTSRELVGSASPPLLRYAGLGGHGGAALCALAGNTE